MRQNEAEILAEKMDRLLRLVGLMAARGLQQRQQIDLLDRAGFEPRDIADLVATSSNTVRVQLVSIRRGRREKKRRGSLLFTTEEN